MRFLAQGHHAPGEDRTRDLAIKSDALPTELSVLPIQILMACLKNKRKSLAIIMTESSSSYGEAHYIVRVVIFFYDIDNNDNNIMIILRDIPLFAIERFGILNKVARSAILTPFNPLKLHHILPRT